MSDIPFDGYALGGVWLNVLFETIDFTTPFIQENKPRYLMGIGIPADIVGAVLHGIDMFDCVLPSRYGRTAQAFLKHGGTLNLRKGSMKDDPRPIEEGCPCPACTKYSRAFIHSLFKENEILAAMLLTWHNIQMYQDLMKNIRQAIDNGTYEDFATEFFAGFERNSPAEYAKFKSPNRTIILKKS